MKRGIHSIRAKIIGSMTTFTLAVGLLAGAPVSAAQAGEPTHSDAVPDLSFAVVSDAHVTTDSINRITHSKDKDRLAHFAQGLDNMKRMDLDAFVNLGDNTRFGTDSEERAFFDTYRNHQPVASDRTLIATGNHDVRGWYKYKYWTNSVADYNAAADRGEPIYYPRSAELYNRNNADYMPPVSHRQNLSFDTWVNGYHFILLNTEKGLKDASWFSDETLAWLKEKLAEGAESGKPIFVLNHQALNDTHYGSAEYTGFGERDAEVKQIFSEYPQVMFLTGHIHNEFGKVEVISRPFGTMVDVPSYSEGPTGSYGQGYVVNVHGDSVEFEARDFVADAGIPSYDVTVETAPSLPETYTQAVKKNSAGYTDASWQDFSSARETARTLLEKTYDQRDLSAKAPVQALYGPDTQLQIKKANADLKRTMASLR